MSLANLNDRNCFSSPILGKTNLEAPTKPTLTPKLNTLGFIIFASSAFFLSDPEFSGRDILRIIASLAATFNQNS